MDEGMVKILLAVIALINAVVVGVLVPYIRSKTTNEQRDNMVAWVRIAVDAAEQMYAAGLLVFPKKQFVLDFLHNKGFKITEEELDLLLEAAVKNMILEEELCEFNVPVVIEN